MEETFGVGGAGGGVRARAGAAAIGPGREAGARVRDERRRARILLVALALGFAAIYEIHTSALQSWLFTRAAARLTWMVQPGPSQQIVFPPDGPSALQLGYAKIPVYRQNLEQHGFRVSEQARFSEPLTRLARWGIGPPYRATQLPGFVIRDATGLAIHDTTLRRAAFRGYDEIPPLAVRTLLFLENRELEEPSDPRSNPAIDWGRFARAGLLFGGRRLGLDLPVEGGSTLATQIEKYRFTPGGRTAGGVDKLRQMAAASLKAYRGGRDTMAERRQILLEYLNTLPLAATPDHGEVLGIGDGLREWFGADPARTWELLQRAQPDSETAAAYRQLLALLYAVRAPSHYLLRDRAGLERRVDGYVRLLAQAGIVEPELARRVAEARLRFRVGVEGAEPVRRGAGRKALNSLREEVRRLIGERGPYELDRLDLVVDTTLDASLNAAADRLFARMRDAEFLRTSGLLGSRLLSPESIDEVEYSLLLFEHTAHGGVLRVQADSVPRAFDLNTGMKLELGSTAKLRTLVHYLEVVAELHAQGLGGGALQARDPLTRWAAETLVADPSLGLAAFLERALDRRYSAGTGETFFSGGGAHTFVNFNSQDDGAVLSVREATVRSTNLVYVRLMRDLVRYHEARLSYDARAVLERVDDPQRQRLLGEIAETEAREALRRAWLRYRERRPVEVVARLLGREADSPRRLVMLFFAWHRDAEDADLDAWLTAHGALVGPHEARRLARAYDDPRLTLADFGYLLDRHPLDVWCAGELFRDPGLDWDALLARSADARRLASAWLFQTRNRRAQDIRLRTRIERDAFERMTPYWRRLGFPFERLVPSLATAIGSSSDRPAALAELLGILVDNGVRRPARSVTRLSFGEGTPYHTVFVATDEPGARVLPAEVARAVRKVLIETVERGTARRVHGAFRTADGAPAAIGGKTGSGDNRLELVARGGRRISSRAVSRTATFAFFLDNRYYGVITASVAGEGAERHRFTSSLPLAVLRLLAPEIDRRLAAPDGAAAVPHERSRSTG